MPRKNYNEEFMDSPNYPSSSSNNGKRSNSSLGSRTNSSQQKFRIHPELQLLAERDVLMENNSDSSLSSKQKNSSSNNNDSDDDDDFIAENSNNDVHRISKYQITSSRHRPVFGIAWNIAKGEEHLYNRQFLNMIYLDREKAMTSLLKVRDANFVRGFHDFSEKLKLKPGNYKVLGSKKEINSVVDMIKTTLKGSVMSAQSLVWRTSRFRTAVSVIQKWIRLRINEIRKVKYELKIKWRVRETAAREKIREELANRAQKQGLRGGGVGGGVGLGQSGINNGNAAAISAITAKATSGGKVDFSQNVAQLMKKIENHESGCGGNDNNNSNNDNNNNPPSHHHHHSSHRSAGSASAAAAARQRQSAPEQRITDLLWALMSDAWMDDEVMEQAIHRCLMHRRCRYVDCFRVWKATSMRDFRKRAENMNVTRTAMKLLECAMSLRFPAIQFTVDGVSVDELAYHAVAVQMRLPEPKPSVPPARPFIQFMKKSIWDQEDEEGEEEEEEAEEEEEDQKDAEQNEHDDEEREEQDNDDDHESTDETKEKEPEVAASSEEEKKQSNNDEQNEENNNNTDKQKEKENKSEMSTLMLLLNDTTNPNNPNRYNTPLQPLPSQKEIFKAEKKQLTATINETLNETIRGGSISSDPNNKTSNNYADERKGWTYTEIAEEFSDRFSFDPITTVLLQTKLPILELSRGVHPPFNFYHALLDFDASKIYLYAFMKQAVCGRRVLLESQLHGKEPQKQCEEAIKVLRTWVYLRTVRALSSEEIAMLDVTKRERYGRDGTPLPRIVTRDERYSPERRRSARVSARTMDQSIIRREPPRSMLEKLIKPDIAASTHHLSTMIGDVDLEEAENYHRKRRERLKSITNNNINSNDATTKEGGGEQNGIGAAAAAASSSSEHHINNINNNNSNVEDSTMMEGFAYRKTVLQAARPYFTRFEENKWEVKRKLEGSSGSGGASKVITPTPPSATAAASSSFNHNQTGKKSNSYNATSGKKPSSDEQQQKQKHHQDTKDFSFSSLSKPSNKPLLDVESESSKKSSSKRIANNNNLDENDDEKNKVYDPSLHSYLPSEIANKIKQDRRYVAPIRQRRAEMNNRIFVTNQRIDHAEEVRSMKAMMTSSRLLVSSKIAVSSNDNNSDDGISLIDNDDYGELSVRSDFFNKSTPTNHGGASLSARSKTSTSHQQQVAASSSLSARRKTAHSHHRPVVQVPTKPTVVRWQPGD